MNRLTRRDIFKAAGVGAVAIALPGMTRRLLGDQPATKPVTVTLYNTGDMHDHSGTLARIAGFVKKQKAADPNTLLLDAGDIYGKGEQQMGATGGEGMARLMTLTGYDACTLGNWDYIHGADRILQLSGKYPTFPLTLCNVNWEDADKPKAVNIPRYRIFKLKGVRLCIAGGACQYFNHAHGRRLKLIHEREGYFRIYDKIKDKADVFVYISHLYDAYDRRMIGKWQTKSPHLLIGGHTHARKIWQQGPTLIVKAGFWGKCLGKTTITYDPAARKVTSIKAGIVNVAGNWPEDDAVKAARAEYFKPKTTVVPLRPVGAMV